MSGRPGRSGGWNKLTPEQHAQRGTSYRKPPRAAHVATAVPLPSAEVPAAIVEGLGPVGRTFVEGVFRSYAAWATHELALLRQAARCLEDAEAAETTRGRHSAIRLFASVVAQLNLTLPQQPPPGPAHPLDRFLPRPGVR